MLGSIVKDISIKVLGMALPTPPVVLVILVLSSNALNKKPPVFNVVNCLVRVAQTRVVGSVLALGVGLRLVNMVVSAPVVVRVVSP